MSEIVETVRADVREAQEFARRAAAIARDATQDDPAISAFALVSIALSLAFPPRRVAPDETETKVSENA